MSAMTIDVRPAASRFEGFALLAVTLVIAGLLALCIQRIAQRGQTEPLYDWQISAFDGLAGADQAIYNALYTVKDEITYIYDDINQFNAPGEKFRWPNLEDLQELLVPPFYRDKSWEQNGSLQWSLFEPLAEGEMQGSTMYLGTAGKLAGQGSFLLVIGHVHAGFTNNNAIVIWWNPANQMAMPESGFRDQLILQGWREVVPYSGAQEVRRLFGEEPAPPAEDEMESIIEGALGEP